MNFFRRKAQVQPAPDREPQNPSPAGKPGAIVGTERSDGGASGGEKLAAIGGATDGVVRTVSSDWMGRPDLKGEEHVHIHVPGTLGVLARPNATLAEIWEARPDLLGSGRRYFLTTRLRGETGGGKGGAGARGGGAGGVERASAKVEVLFRGGDRLRAGLRLGGGKVEVLFGGGDRRRAGLRWAGALLAGTMGGGPWAEDHGRRESGSDVGWGAGLVRGGSDEGKGAEQKSLSSRLTFALLLFAGIVCDGRVEEVPGGTTLQQLWRRHPTLQPALICLFARIACDGRTEEVPGGTTLQQLWRRHPSLCDGRRYFLVTHPHTSNHAHTSTAAAAAATRGGGGGGGASAAANPGAADDADVLFRPQDVLQAGACYRAEPVRGDCLAAYPGAADDANVLFRPQDVFQAGACYHAEPVRDVLQAGACYRGEPVREVRVTLDCGVSAAAPETANDADVLFRPQDVAAAPGAVDDADVLFRPQDVLQAGACYRAEPDVLQAGACYRAEPVRGACYRAEPTPSCQLTFESTQKSTFPSFPSLAPVCQTPSCQAACLDARRGPLASMLAGVPQGTAALSQDPTPPLSTATIELPDGSTRDVEAGLTLREVHRKLSDHCGRLAKLVLLPAAGGNSTEGGGAADGGDGAGGAASAAGGGAASTAASAGALGDAAQRTPDNSPLHHLPSFATPSFNAPSPLASSPPPTLKLDPLFAAAGAATAAAAAGVATAGAAGGSFKVRPLHSPLRPSVARSHSSDNPSPELRAAAAPVIGAAPIEYRIAGYTVSGNTVMAPFAETGPAAAAAAAAAGNQVSLASVTRSHTVGQPGKWGGSNEIPKDPSATTSTTASAALGEKARWEGQAELLQQGENQGQSGIFQGALGKFSQFFK
ncbi:unnamed protein product [Closterium sp. NIES-64]|nr:unnamed protein product [Closterium sp. NIES-64]